MMLKQPDPEPHDQYLVRFEYKRTRGWLFKKKGHSSRLFSDSKYEDSHREARIYRDSVVKGIKYLGPCKPREKFSLNTSGTVGVGKMVDRYGRFVGWRAYASLTPNCQTVIPFPKSIHGRKAKQRAIKARNLLLQIFDLSRGLEE